MEEKWCQDTRQFPPVMLLGAMGDRQPPEQLHGMISALLLRGSVMGADIQDELEFQGFPLPRVPFRMALFAVDDASMRNLQGRDRYHRCIRIYQQVRERLAAAQAQSPGGFLVLLMGYLFGVFYGRPCQDSLPEICRDAVDYAGGRGASLHVTVSGYWSGADKLETAYRMLQDVESSRRFYTDTIERIFTIPEGAIRRISDGVQRTQFEQTFFQSADRICGSVRAGDSQAAAEYLQEQLRRIAENCIGMPYPTTLNLTINRFLSLLQYRLVDQDLADWRFLSQEDFSRGLVSCPDLAAYREEGRRIAQKLVEHSRVRTQQRYDSMMHDMRAYIERNATDVNMGLTAVAREFKIKPREAAESFRQYYGESVNDVIHKSRVRLAKELLLTTNDSVQDIAKAVGYCSLATMYRAFTNVEGVAPGKLRQSRGHGASPEAGSGAKPESDSE